MSEWTDLGTVMDTIHGTTLELSPEPRAAFGGATVEIAHKPLDGERWSYRWQPDELPLIVWVPVDLDLKGIVTSDQMLDRIRDYVKDRPAGPAPRRIKFYSHFGGGDERGRHAKWWDLYYAFGYFGPGFGLNKAEPGWDRVFGGDPNRKGLSYSHTDPHTDLQKLRAEFSDPAYKPVIERLEAFSIGDEIGINAFGDADDEKFREHLKARGFTLERLGVKDWSEVRLVGSGQAASHPVMYVEAREFGEVRAIANMKALTTAIREAFGRDVPIGANYAPHPIFLPEEAQWIDAFREGA